MTLKGDAKLKGKLTLGSKNHMRNLVNFNASSGKSENLHFALLSIAYKAQVKSTEETPLMTLKSGSLLSVMRDVSSVLFIWNFICYLQKCKVKKNSLFISKMT